MSPTPGLSIQLLFPFSWHQTRHRYSHPPFPQRWPHWRNALFVHVCVPELPEPWLHSEGKEERRLRWDTVICVTSPKKCRMQCFTSSKLGSNFNAFSESTKTIGEAIASLRLFPNQRWFMSAWKRNRTIRCNLPDGKVMITEWITAHMVDTHKDSTCYDNSEGISLQQFILMALSVIAMDTYWGHPSRDHTPSSRSNHQRLRLRLQDSGSHGGGRLLPYEQDKSFDWQDRRLAFRLISVRGTSRKLF